MKSNGSFMNTVVVGFMLFALFFGAGNLIFPPMLGQASGENYLLANLGFVVTGVGLPIVSIIALAYSGKSDLQSLASRVHPIYGVLFTVALYLSIGPLFAIPRTNTASFEIGIKSFLDETDSFIPLLIYTIIFFGVTLFFSLQSQKLVDIVGKMLTPILLIFIIFLIGAAFLNPMGDIQAPTEQYVTGSFFVGFQEGYLTMDALAAFVFGIIIINIMKTNGAETKKKIMISSMKVALIAGILLAFIYTSLSYLGATSVEGLGMLDNGGEILSSASYYYFGSFGKIVIAVIVIAACLTTSIGLITACAAYFTKIIPSISYKVWAVIFTIFSAILANFGLSTLIEYSVPVLSILYPLAICLLILTFLHPLFKGRRLVYQLSILFTFIVSFVKELKINIFGLHQLFTDFLPLYTVGLGWLLPALIGGIIGFLISLFSNKTALSS